MTLEIRHIRLDELPAFVETLTTVFLDPTDVVRVAEELALHWDLERTWAAIDGDRLRSTFRTWPTEQTVPGGGQLRATALTAVTVMPTHRRRGILTQMIAAEHGAARERGEALGLLYASEFAIYGRFGYGPATRDATWSVDVHRTAFAGAPASGVDIVKPTEETRDAVKAVFDAWRVRQVGEIGRREPGWDYELGLRDTARGDRWKGFLALHRDSTGAVDGYARYRATDKREDRQPRTVIEVEDLHALTDEAYASLWRFLADLDLVATVRAERRSPGERLRWHLTNARAATVSDIGDGVWVRLLDVPRALEARGYERSATVVLELIDNEAAGGRTRVLVDASADGARCTVTDRSPDLTLDIAALGAAYLGGTSLRDAVLAEGVDEHRAGALAEADALLRTLNEPWCSTFF